MLHLLLFVFQSSTAPLPGPNDWADAPRVLEEARRWREGRPIPDPLLHFRQSGGCFGSPMDTSQLISQIQNLPLLVELVLSSSADADTHEEAMGHALSLVGPTKLFQVLVPRVQRSPAPRSPWLVELQRRFTLRHVVVDGLFIEYADMSDAKAKAVLDRIERDLRSGEPWQRVYEEYSHEFGYDTGSRTSIGNLGDFVVFPDPDLTSESHITRLEGAFTGVGKTLPRRLSRLTFLPGAHTPAILRARRGDVLRLEDANMREHVLYAVREVYEGGAPNMPLQPTVTRAPLGGVPPWRASRQRLNAGR